MSYLVFSRKYRPQTFDDVIGQEHVGQTLRNAIAHGRLGHAYLFSGPRGVGKTTMARILAKAVNCLVSPGIAPCGTCEACKGIAAGGDVDVLEIDAASNRKVEEVEPLIDAARYLPQRSPRKVFIVDEAHMLSTHAWNALLKTVEEPPPHVLFVFATTAPNKVPATVRSRCQCFDFRSIGASDIEGKLKRIAAEEGLALDEGVLKEIAARATGGLRDAESLLDQILSAAPAGRPVAVSDLVALLGDTPREVRLAILDHARRGAMKESLAAAEEIVRRGADPLELLRDLYGDLQD
ncbi:MAG: DNA polymerase III subunit gamma/tau [Planctomycetota bacterium]